MGPSSPKAWVQLPVGAKRDIKLTKRELIKESNRQNVGEDEEILTSMIKKSETNDEKAISKLATIDYVGGMFINITIGGYTIWEFLEK